MASTPNFVEMQDFSKQQFEAITSASSTLTKGLQDLAVESTDYTKKAFAAGTETFEKLLGAKSLEAAIQIQSDYAKQSYEGFVAQSSKMSELLAKFASEAMKPVTAAYANFQPK
ncbi:phasin protein [Roseiarcus fermentans]|uniref:Phasin protein n=1 Tax=Roseiarcus fermentans TaxID=1473586 RepID=A0A366FQ97_9HYPH|nr:phasin family protein [Roseiarcus fermentans]RBP16737.1 phasin protein [Roseiarcus fermentans]